MMMMTFLEVAAVEVETVAAAHLAEVASPVATVAVASASRVVWADMAETRC